MPTCLLLSNDLIFTSRIQQAANHAGVECLVVQDEVAMCAASDNQPSTVFIDLQALGDMSLSAIQAASKALPEARIIAFGPHVQADLLEAARQAGANLVLPRSAFVQQLPSLLSD